MTNAPASHWQRFRKLAEVPINGTQWQSHAQCPTVYKINASLWRIYFAGRDDQNRSSVYSLDVDPRREMHVTALRSQPVVMPGPPGTEHCDGVGLSFVYKNKAMLEAFCAQIQRHENGRYAIKTGLFTSLDDGLSFDLTGKPVVVTHPELSSALSPVFQAYPFILQRSEGFQMWFSDGVRWDDNAVPTPEVYYDIKQAFSPDGRIWTVDDTPAIPLAPDECGLFRPIVVQRLRHYEMWYCARGPHDALRPERRRYRIGYATSTDGRRWQRQDDQFAFLNPPVSGDWDFEMQCYPWIETADDGAQYMFYCGNEYGRHGFGFAKRVPAQQVQRPEGSGNG